MSEDFQLEDEAEKLTENPNATIMKYISEHGIASLKDLVKLLVEKCDLGEDKAEKLVKSYVTSGKLKFIKKKGGYYWPSQRHYLKPKFNLKKLPPRRKPTATIGNVMHALHLPSNPHKPVKESHFLAKNWHPYYHPSMDKDKLGYLKAREKMGEGADWPA